MSRKLQKYEVGSGNVFADIGLDPARAQVANLRRVLARERRQFRAAAGWMYQFAGACGADAQALDNLSALSSGEPPPHRWKYPALPKRASK